MKNFKTTKTLKLKQGADLELDYLDMTIFMCNEIQKDNLTINEKCQLALQLQKAKMILHDTIFHLTTSTGVRH